MSEPEKTETEVEDVQDELKPGHTLLQGQFTIEAFLNSGGFGITYLARDSLDRVVVIKECFPGALCRRTASSVHARSRAHMAAYTSVVSKFVDEAHSLAKVKHPNVVGVHQVFEDNKTAYMVLDFVEGQDLLDMIDGGEDLPKPDQIETILRKLLDAISHIHRQDMLHRDISPDNILLTSDMEPILIDFGAARQEAVHENRAMSELRVVKDGYSPQEFYLAGAEQGPYSDLYALAATFYHVITGGLPVNSQNRIAAIAGGGDDPYVPLVGNAEGYSDAFLRGIDKALSPLPKDRFASAESWLALLDGNQVTPPSGTSGSSLVVATAVMSKPMNKTRARVLAAIGLAVPIMGGIYVLQSDGADPSLAVVAPASESAQAPVDVAAVDPAQDAVPASTEPTAPAADVSALLNLAAVATAQPETDAPETPATPDGDITAALNLGSASAALGLPTSEDLAPAVDAGAANPEGAPVGATPPASTTTIGAVQPLPQSPLVIESFDLPQIKSAWTIDFTDVQADGTYAINGVALGPIGDVDGALHQMMQAPEDSTIELSVLESDAENADVIDTVLVPVIHRTSFPDGTVFETREIEGSWTTKVAKAPVGSDFQVDDVLMGDLGTEQPFNARTSLPEALVRAKAQNFDSLTLAVQRQDNVTATSLLLP